MKRSTHQPPNRSKKNSPSSRSAAQGKSASRGKSAVQGKQGRQADSGGKAEGSHLAGPQRLNKLLAAAGLGARRQVDELIEQGRVEVDGQVVDQVGMKVDPETAKITVDGTQLRKLKPVYYALHKPAGIFCTNRDPEGRQRAVDLIPGNQRLFAVGRLDAASVGLLLLTNDGELTQQLTHPKYGVPKTYFVVVAGKIEHEALMRLRRGIYLSDGVARVDFVKMRKVKKGSTELEITLSEGKNREIRRILARLGHKVVTLRRLSIGPLKMGNMPVGAYRPLTKEEVTALYGAVEVARKAKKQRKQINDQRAQEIASKRPAKVETDASLEASQDESKSRSTKTKKKVSPDKIKKPIKGDFSPKKDPFDWDDDELLVASPFGADYRPSSDDADDDEDGWVKPLMDDSDEAHRTQGKRFHEHAGKDLSGDLDDAILANDFDGEADDISDDARIGEVIDYEDENSLQGRSPQGGKRASAARSSGPSRSRKTSKGITGDRRRGTKKVAGAKRREYDGRPTVGGGKKRSVKGFKGRSKSSTQKSGFAKGAPTNSRTSGKKSGARSSSQTPGRSRKKGDATRTKGSQKRRPRS